MAKKRLDVLLTEQGYFESRQKAQATIMSGLVFVNGQRVDKAGAAVAEDAQIEVRGKAIPYVSRGGLKLEKAMQVFQAAWTVRSVPISVHLPADFPTVCSKTAQPRSTLWIPDMGSWTGRSAATRE